MPIYPPASTMREDIRDEWAKRVLDPAYTIGRGFLKRWRYDRGAAGPEILHCPYGVLCEMAVEEHVIPVPRETRGDVVRCFVFLDKNTGMWESGVLPTPVVEWSGLDNRMPTVVVTPEQMKEWDLQTFTGVLYTAPTAIRLSSINDHSTASRADLAGLIKTL